MADTQPLDEGADAKVGFLQGKVTVGLEDGEFRGQVEENSGVKENSGVREFRGQVEQFSLGWEGRKNRLML